MDLTTKLTSTPVTCKICGSSSNPFARTLILRKYDVQYFRCEACGFMQTETPFWLDEAYSTAIARLDVGIMQRNLANRQLTSAVLNLLFPNMSRAVDFGAGHGALVRMMRDRGFNFFWFDLHASNDYARGFEYEEGVKYDFLTAFEVLEHLVDPVAEFSTLMDLSDNVFVSTFLVPKPVPALADWWYYAPLTGQHIAFHTQESLRILANRFGRHLLSHGPYHLFTKEPKSSLRYSMATRLKLARVLNTVYRRPSLIEHDVEQMKR